MDIHVFDRDHYDQVARIYQEGIDTGCATFETTVPAWGKWDQSHLHFGRLAVMADGIMMGWTALSPVSSRCVYGGVAEVSIYIAEIFRNRNIGRRLLTELIKVSEENNIWTLQAGIFRENVASLKLHQHCGFRIVGYKEKIGQLRGRWYDNVFLERRSKTVGIS